MSRRRDRRLAWAIDANSGEGHGLIGIYWFSHATPEHMDGYRIATWATFERAKKALKSVRVGFPKAKVVRVEASVGRPS